MTLNEYKNASEAISLAKSILIFTDNALNNGRLGLSKASPCKNNVEMVEWFRLSLKWSTDSHNFRFRKATSTLYLPPTCEDDVHRGCDCKLKNYYTAKIFLLNTEPDTEKATQSIHEALHELKTVMGIEKLDLLLLSFSTAYDSGDSDTEASMDDIKYFSGCWRVAEALYKSGAVKNIGVADFTINQLKLFCRQIGIIPQVLQISSGLLCRGVPSELQKFAQDNSILLQSHSDYSKLLNLSSMKALVEENNNGNEILQSELQSLQETLEFKPVWAMKFTTFVSDRGVLSQLRYAVKMERQLPLRNENGFTNLHNNSINERTEQIANI